MGYKRNEKIIIEILEEIADKSNIETSVELDLSRPEKLFNWNLLQQENDGLVSYFTAQVKEERPGYSVIHNDRTGIFGLTVEGHRYLCDLKLKHQKIQLMIEQNERDRKRFRYDILAVLVAAVALLVSVFRE